MNEVNERVRYKHELVNFLLFDYEGVEMHLEKMAARGWILDTIGQSVWKYRKSEPAKLKYAVTYAPDASIFAPEPSENQQTLEDFCAQAGWIKVGDWSQAQIFVNDRENPVPIETDEEIRLEVIRNSMHKSWIPANVVLILLMIFNTWRSINNFTSDPVTILSNYWMLMSQVFVPIAFVLIASNLVGYIIWMKKSRRQVEQGGRCCSPRIVRQLNKWSLLVVMVYFVLLIMSTISSGASFATKYMITYIIGFVGLVAILNVTREALKKRGASRATNMAVFVVLDIVLAFVMVGGVTAFALSDIFSTDRSDEDPYVPKVQSTFVATHTEAKQAGTEVYYEISEIKMEGLLQFCFEKTVDEYQRFSFFVVKEEPDEKEWGVDKSYREYTVDGNPGNEWILLKDNYIIEIFSPQELTAGEKAAVINKLGGE